ncbi:MAG TPA: GatB/YqeY domain-containing protein [Syntrophorhabdales bacterium]|nr:GatB/YqeY domain-containing protein [Syntrophorhabdales bacterium]
MAHKEEIEQGLKKALKEKDALRVSVLRMLLSSLNYKEVEKRKPLTEEEFFGVVKSMIKQHGESIESFTKGGRPELAEKETKELEILKEFVPSQIEGEALSSEVEAAVAAVGAKDLKDMGKVMKLLMEKLASRVDGKVLSEMVRKRLSP